MRCWKIRKRHSRKLGLERYSTARSSRNWAATWKRTVLSLPTSQVRKLSRRLLNAALRSMRAPSMLLHRPPVPRLRAYSSRSLHLAQDAASDCGHAGAAAALLEVAHSQGASPKVSRIRLLFRFFGRRCHSAPLGLRRVAESACGDRRDAAVREAVDARRG